MKMVNCARVVYWHRELPPIDAEPVGEHTIEAVSGRVPGTIAHRDDPWRVCHAELMDQARRRIEQEVSRLDGDYAHVFDEAIETRRDDVGNEAWLHGRFDYVLYRRQRPFDVPVFGPEPAAVVTGSREQV